MFSRLTSLVRPKGPKPGKIPSMLALASGDSDRSTQDFDFVSITNPKTVNRLLQQMDTTHSKISIILETDGGEPGTFYSTIAKINKAEKQIILHQLQPTGWRQHLRPKQIVEVNCFLPSGQMSFFCNLSPLEEDRDNYYCVLTHPTEINKFQLRSAFRVFMPPGSCKVGIKIGRKEFEGVGLDLSLDGCCLRFIGDVYSLLEEESTFRDLSFNILSGSVEFKVDAKICRLANRQGGQTIAGVKFLNLPTPVKKQLQSALAEVQRIQLRQQVQLY